VGFPIRKSADQSSFAAPHGLSQRSTSFIASQRQGIHQTPLRHLIALIINAHCKALTFERPACKIGPTAGGQAPPTCSACRVLRIGSGGELLRARLERIAAHGARIDLLFTMSDSSRPRACAARQRENSVMADERSPGWWSQTGSNRRPPACKAGALPTELWPLQGTEIRRQKSESAANRLISDHCFPIPGTGGPGTT
jgi:hypothetical protein